MGIINRFLLFVYACVTLLCSVFMIIFVVKTLPADIIFNEIEFLMGQDITLTALIVFAVCSAYFLLYAYFVSEDKKKEEPQEDNVRIKTDRGEVQVSKEAIATLADREAEQISGVRESNTKVTESQKEGEAHLSLALDLILTAGADVPQVTVAVRDAVSSRIAMSLGEENVPIEISVRELSNTPVENQRRVH